MSPLGRLLPTFKQKHLASLSWMHADLRCFVDFWSEALFSSAQKTDVERQVEVRP